ncbi:MAG: hypothetical protein ACI4NE_08095 [Succinivibrio sp.]
MPKLIETQEKLVKDGIIFINTKVNRYDICNEKAYKYFQSAAIWLLASTQEFECQEIFIRYRQRNEIEVMYRYFKNHVDADTLNVSKEQTFNAKLFIGLLASEFLNSLKLKSLEWNKTAPEKSKVKLKDNSMCMTFKDLDTLDQLSDNLHEYPSTPTKKWILTSVPPTLTFFSPKSICRWSLGMVSYLDGLVANMERYSRLNGLQNCHNVLKFILPKKEIASSLVMGTQCLSHLINSSLISSLWAVR